MSSGGVDVIKYPCDPRRAPAIVTPKSLTVELGDTVEVLGSDVPASRFSTFHP